ncbi:MAG: sigma 54-interacting transcriptional regulator, partial [Holophagales bacterium]|nr:sigma 54-interacting transcriptional regulator [Holophagales bacterium]
GKFRAADHGTLFLDEVGEMPLKLQAKLLRAVEQKSIQPVGDTETPVDVRVIAATNKDLARLTETGDFRSDLYYRLAGVVLEVPSLRERRDDIAPLMEHFLRLTAEAEGKHIRGLTVKALRVLEEYAWPGNVRELIHEAKRLGYLAADNHVVDSSMLSERLLISDPEPSGLPEPSRGNDPAQETPGASPRAPALQALSAACPVSSHTNSLQLRDHVRETERQIIREALAEAAGSQRKAAQLLGISRTTLRRKIADLAISA